MTGLGEVVSVHRARMLLAVVLAPAVAFPILLFGFFAGAILEVALGLPKWSGIIVAGAIWAATLGASGYWLGGRGGRAAAVYADGLAVKDADHLRAWRWEEIESVNLERTTQRTVVPQEAASIYLVFLVILRLRKSKVDPSTVIEYKYAFRDVLGGSCVLDQWLPNVESIGARVQAEVARNPSRREAAANRISARAVGSGPVFTSPIPVLRRSSVRFAILMASFGVVLAGYLWLSFFHVQDRVPPRAIVAPEFGRSFDIPDVFDAPAARITITSGQRGSERAAGGSRADRDNIELFVTYTALAPYDPDPTAWHFISAGADFGYAILSLEPDGKLASGQTATGTVWVSGVVVGVPAIITYKGTFDDAPLLVIHVAP